MKMPAKTIRFFLGVRNSGDNFSLLARPPLLSRHPVCAPFVVTFSNRMFPSKAVRLWREASEAERVYIVEDFFALTPGLEPPTASR